GPATQVAVHSPGGGGGPGVQIGLVLVSAAEEAGIDIELKAMPGSAHWDAFDSGEYDISSHWICGMQFDPIQLYGWYHSDNYFPVGERTNRGNAVRLQSDELDALIDELETLDPEGEASRPTFDEALTVFLNELPTVASIQTIYPVFFSTSVWEGWPTEGDPYSIPADWWGHFLFVIGNLKRAGSSSPAGRPRRAGEACRIRDRTGTDTVGMSPRRAQCAPRSLGCQGLRTRVFAPLRR